MSTSHSQSGGHRFGLRSRRAIAAFAAYALSLTTVVFGALPVTPAAAAPGDADLAVTKVASSGSALLGTSIDFTVTVTNLGPGDTTGVAVTDVLPAEFTFQSASATQGSYDAGTGIWSIGSMLLGSSQTLTITAEANSIAFVTNFATITASNEFDPVPGNNSASAAVNIATVPPAVCETNDIIGIVGDTIYSIDTTTGVATPEFQTAFVTGNRNALASNRDLGIVYWGSAAVVYWWNPIDDTEGVLVDLTGQINGTLESAGATYYQGHYYFSTEVSGNANGLYRIAIDPTSGTQVIPGSLELLAANQPEDGLEAEFGRDMRPDYGDLTVVTVNGDPLLFGSTVDGFDWPSYGGHWWSYNLNTGAFTFIADEPAPNHVQLGTDLNGDTWGTDASGNLYAVNQATGEFVPTGLAVGFGLYDLSGSFCVPPELADIDLAKSMIANADEDGSNSVSVGDTLTYQFTVTNTGNSVLSSVVVTDPLIPGLSCSIGSLSAGATSTCTGAYQVVLADQLAGFVANTATTVGTAPSGATVSDTASAIVLVAQPEVVVTKTSDAAGSVVAGQVISYTVEVENTGVFDINGLNVSDPLPAGTSYVDQSTLVDGWDAGTAAGSWSAEVGTDTTIPENCAAPLEFDFDMASVGEVGDVDVGFAASHGRRGQLRALLTSPAGTTAVLMPGTSGDRDNNYDVLFDGDSTGPLDDGNADDVTPVDYERSVGAISLETFVGENGAGTWTLQVCDNNTQGALGTFRQATLFITGVASNPMTMVKDNIPGGAEADLIDGVPPVLVAAADGFDLPMGESMTVTYQVRVDGQLDGSVLDIVNDVFVFSAELPTTTDYTIDPIDFLPELQVAKDGPAGPVSAGDLVTYTYTVDHTSASDGSPVDVTLTDDVIDLTGVIPSGDTNGDGLLDGGETWVYTVDYTIPADAADPLVNVATVSGTDLNGEPITEASDDHSVAIEFAPVLTVQKVGAPDPAGVGDTITYTYTVRHDAASDLSEVGNVVVTDSRGIALSGPTGDTDGDNLLDGDEVWVYTATETVTVGTPDPLTNDVVVTGTDRDGDPIAEATDSESIDIDWAPAIAVDKTGPATAAIGDTVTYTFTITHGLSSDGSPVMITSVADDVASGETYVSGDDGDGLLENGEAWVYEASYTILATDPDPLVNVVTVSGTDADGEPVADATDTHSTDIDHLPVLVLTKTGPASALIGETVTFDFSVQHDLSSDNTAVSGVTVTDDVAGPATYVGGDDGDGLLEVGEVWIFTVTYTTQPSDPDPLVNIGTVSGVDEDGDPVGDTDTHSTDLIPTASIGDLIWEDLDADGVVDSGEPGLDGVTVRIFDGTGTLVDTAVTAAGGAYSFTDLAPGDYTVDVDEATLPFIGILSTGNEPYAAALAEGENDTDADFGYFALAVLGDFVWDDLDGNGIQDGGEPGIGGTTVTAFAASDLTTPVATTTTFGDGSWNLSLVPGTYVIEFTLPAGFVFTAANVGVDDTVDSDADGASGLTTSVLVSSGDTNETVDAGGYVPATIGDFVWNDLDGDGSQDGGEPGIGGVTVRVFDPSGTEIASATTLADGSYSVAVAPGTYDVVVDVASLPAGFVLTTPDTVATGALASGATFGDADFGAVVPTFPISGTVWNDEDVDSSIDAGEPRLGGVAVELLDSGGGLIATVLTAADGSYDFPPVPDGDYSVAVDETTVPAGMSLTTANNPESVTVGGAAVTDVDFGYAYPGVVQVTKDPATQQVASGGSADFTITVTNPGPQDLTGVVVTDASAPGCDSNIGAMVSGSSVSYGCSLAGVTADFTNTAVVGAVDELGNAVTDSDDAFVDVIAPAIDITKTPNLNTILSGADVTFTIRVENTGDTDLTAVVVTDVLTPDCDASFATLVVGEVESYTCQATNVTADFTNIAAVTGDDPLGDPVTDSDDADVDVIAPAIEIDKTPDLQQVLVNGTAVFTITVRNTGDVELSNVSVADALASDCDANLGSLAAGATTSYSCSAPSVAADFTNVAVVTGDHAAGGAVTASDDAVVDVIAPEIEIEKTPDTQQARAGDTVTFDITVTNTGDVDLTDVTVTDPVASDCAASLGTLAPTASATYSCSMTAGALDFTNTAFVTGDDPLGNAVTDNDDADVDVINPAIEIEKTPDTQQARAGDTVTFDITLTNNGDVALTDVSVSDVVAPDCDANLGTLAAGAATTYSCTMTAGPSDFTNTAFVTGDDPLGNAVTDSDDADVDVINPAISIEKTPDTQQARAGDTVTFDITVTNTGDVALTDVTVADPVASDCAASLGTLAAAESTTYSCSMTAGSADFTNVADVTGNDPLGNAVTDSDSADVDVINPAIEIEKTPDTQQARDGDTVTFDITVTNTGDVALDAVTVSDVVAPDCDASLGTLAAGAATTYSCTMTAGPADFTNVADVTGNDPLGNPVTDSDDADVDVINPAIEIEKTPDTQQARDGDTVTFDITVTNTGDVDLADVTVTDPIASDCDANLGTLAAGAATAYSCSMTAGPIDFTNVADVTGNDPLGNPVTDSDDADVDLINPAISIEKTPDTQQARDGDTVTFAITVTNTGDVDLADVTVTDPIASDCDANLGTLAAGAATTYSCTMTAGAIDFTNVAFVTGNDPLGNPVTDSDSADVDVINPAIEIEKTPDTQQARPGDTVTFDITVTNTGDVALTAVSVSDVVAPDCDASLGTLAAGAATTYSCTMTAGPTDFTNVADVTGDDPLGDAVTDSDGADVDVINPAIEIEKTPDLQQILPNGIATFTISVTNTGDVTLTDVTVSDPAAPDCDATFATMAPGAAQTYSCTVVAGSDDFTNVANVAGNDPLGNPVADSDDADVDVINPAISIEKTPDTQQVLNSGTATFTIAVANTGDVDLANVTVSDPLAADCAATIGVLAAGASTNYTCSLGGITADFTNIASVVGTHPAGGTVSATDDADVDVINPAIEIEKTPDTQQARDGDTVTFDISVTNTGDVALTAVSVSDVVAPGCDATLGTLAAGAATTYSCTMVAGPADFTNVADVTGNDPLGNPVTDSDDADVDVIAPEIEIAKTPDTQQARDGDLVTFGITVTNTGDVDLNNIVVADPLAPGCDRSLGSLAVGASTSYPCSMVAGATDFTNTAFVTGDDPLGNAVTDSDDADVDLINPAISIEKTPDTQQARDGDTVTFDITVTNTGDVALAAVTVSDVVAPDCDASLGTLAAGASTTYPCTMTAGAIDFTNVAFVTGDDPLGNAVTDSDGADVDVIAPAIEIEKTPDTQQARPGDTVTFDITVTNAGDVALAAVTVSDVVAPDCDASLGTLAAGASTTYSCTMVAGPFDFTNTAFVTGDGPLGNAVTDSDGADVDVINPAISIEKTPDSQQAHAGDTVTFDITVTNTGDVALTAVTITDPLAPNCDAGLGTLAPGAATTYSCTMVAGLVDFTNVADVTGNDPLGDPVTASDDADVDVINPAIEIEKTPDTQQARPGDAVTFDITVTNTGDVDLTGVAVTDVVAPSCVNSFALLAAGASASYSCTMTAGAADFTNTAAVTGDDPLGLEVSDSDDADVDVINPAISIGKTPDIQQARPGDTVTFDITVTNTGDVDLADVTVADPVALDCDADLGTLAAGAATSYSCTMTAGVIDFTNTASVTGNDPLGNPVTDSDDADVDVINPAISISKTPDSQQAHPGDTVTFGITVTNTGDVDLNGVAVTDVLAPDCDAALGTLAAGASTAYSCTMVAGPADFTNVADATGDDPLGDPVTDSDGADVDVINPAISISKTPDSQEAINGATVTFDITVANTGDVDLTDVTVTDPVASDCDADLGTLAVGASTAYSCTMVAGPADFTNTAAVTGDDPLGDPVTDSDDADVDVVNPAIDIEKTPDFQQILNDGTATFTITVTNTGDVPLSNVIVADPLAPDCDATYATLAAGAGDTYICSVANVTADFTNVVDVSGEHPASPVPVTDSDDAEVDVIAPAIDIQKTTTTPVAVSGADVTFTIRVENTGDSALSNVVVTDAAAPACDSTLAALAIGEVQTYTCTVSGVTADFTNTADVVADEPSGDTVSDSDSADVDVIAPAITIDKTPDLQATLPGGSATFTITVTNSGDVELSGVLVTDPLAPDCNRAFPILGAGASETYSCILPVVLGDFTNVASVIAFDQLGNPVTDDDSADVVIEDPAIEITKTAATPTVVAGDDAVFDITVTNIGTTALTAVTVTDVLTPDCVTTIPILAVGESSTYSCTASAVTVDFTNTAVVSATHPLSGTVGDVDTADVDVINPSLRVTKNPPTQQIRSGDTATFTISVENTGDVDLTGVAVSDPLSPSCDNNIGDLAAGSSVTYSCAVAPADDFTNVASVAGLDPLGNTITDSDDAVVDVINPAIAINKSPDSQIVVLGGVATFTISVDNTGDVDLTDVTVADAATPACDNVIGNLAAGATATYSCDAVGVAADFTNTATVSGLDPLGDSVTDLDTATVDVIDPSITLAKDPATQQILAGEDANFTITVTNTGDSPLTNVVITDAQAPLCDTVIPALGIGASATVTCAAPGVAGSFTNTASVVATHQAGGSVSDSDSADVEVLVPQIDIQKTPNLQTIALNGTATFDITVTNAGVIPLSNVNVRDALAPNCDNPIGDLSVGAAVTYTCTLADVTTDFTNTAVVDATDAAGNPATDSDTAAVDVVAPAISIEKTPDAQAIVLNDIPVFDISVTNTGDVDLTNVSISDPLAPACDVVIPVLLVGESTSYTCSGTATGGDFTNTANVTADSVVGQVNDSDTAAVTVLVPAIDIQKTPDTQLVGLGGTATFTITVTNAGATPLTDVTVSDPQAPSCDAAFALLPVGAVESYTCDVTGVTGDFTNTASVTGDDPLGSPVTDSDAAEVDFVDPAIGIEKTPDLQTLLAGEDASFSITVTNTGDTELTNVVIVDAAAPGCGATFATLAAGASETVTCDVVGVIADFINTASVTADTPLGTQVSASDDAVVDVVSPGVEIQKTPDTQMVHNGDNVMFTITVANTGDQDLVDLVVTDALTPACDAVIPALAVGESISYDCTASAVSGDFTNIAAVDGADALGNLVSDSDDAQVDVINPAIAIQKTPDTQAVVVNGVAVFDITVSNTGDVDLDSVAISDPLAPACDATIGALVVGATSTYTCSVSGVAADFTNIASATGIDPLGAAVSASDGADVTVLVPAVDIQKTPDLQQVRVGDPVDFTITVTNAGATALSNVTVTDPLVPACDAVVGDLAVGESASYTCTLPVSIDDFTNTAEVVATDPIGNSVTDNDSADVDVIAPAISISKSPDGQTVVIGGTATFTIEVTNTGDVDLINVAVGDVAVPACDSAIGALAVGESASYTCSVDTVTTDFTNVADVVGTDPLGLVVTDSDTADVTVLVPGIDIQKTPDTQTIIAGDDATFTIVVTNTGQTDLLNVAIVDPLVPACDSLIGNLPVGSPPVTYTCTAPVAASFTNTATVSAVDPIDSPIGDSDTADVVALIRSNIAGTIAYDVAGDGLIDATDLGLAGIDVTATWAGLDGVFGTPDDLVFATVTDSNGDYGFDLVPPGEYRIDVDTTDLPAGIDTQTLDPDASLDSETTLTVAEDTTVVGVDFAYTATGSIGDLVFLDLDADGVQGPGEPGVGGITVTVTWLGRDGVAGGGDDVVFTTTTLPNGSYEVNGLPAGEFIVVIGGVPAGLSGDLDQSVTLGAAEERDDVDFPLVGSGSIGDQVFEDLDYDGVFDSGEPGIAGVTVNVTWAGADGIIGTGDDVVISTVTDGNGQYQVDLLPPGEYVVAVDDSTIPADLGSAAPVTLTLAAGESNLTADFPLVRNRPPVAVDDDASTDEDTPVTIAILVDDSDPDGHGFAVSDTTDPTDGSIVVNPDGTITYTPNPGFVGVDTFTYTICETDGVVNGVAATGLCDTATVTVTVVAVNEPPGPDASFQTVVVGDPVDPIPVVDPDGGAVTVTYVSGELPPGITLNPDGTFNGVTTEIGTYQVILQVCDDDDPQICIIHTHTIAVTPTTLPGPDDPDPDDPDPDDPPETLPFTGANLGELFRAALTLLFAGAALVLFARKRRAGSTLGS